MSETRQTGFLLRVSMSGVEDFERCYRAVQSRDARFDGWFFTAVTSTGIYCRPSCPALTPKRENVRFYPTAAAAQQAGFRACLRCRPDAAPGSPAWLGRADVAARAVRLVFDGVVDREGVSGLARRLGYGERQLHRVLVAEVGTGALSLARAQRAQTARLLLETTDLPVARVAFAAGFTSVRQCNDTVKEVFARTPTELRQSARRRARGKGAPDATPGAPAGAAQTIAVRLAYRRPFAGEPLLGFLGTRAVPGLESFDGTVYRRALVLPHGPGAVELRDDEGFVHALFHLGDVRDLTTAIARCRHLCNLDADPVAVDGALGEDAALAPLVRAVPGMRVPGSVDGFETAVRAVIGQQVSVQGARTIAAGLCAAAGKPLGLALPGLERTFPDAEALASLAETQPEAFPMPAGRRRALASLAGAVASGHIVIDAGVDPSELSRQLEALHGIGPWTSSYVALRAVGDPDAFLAGDLGARRGAARLGLPDDPAGLLARAEQWRPWRAYALMHLWDSSAASTQPAAARRRGTARTGREQGESAA